MIDTNNIKPAKDSVIIELLKLEDVYDELITTEASNEEDVAVRYGNVLSIGPEVDSNTHCENLKVNDTVLFTEFAGYYITSDEDRIFKVIRGYDIIGKVMSITDISNSNFIPTSDRILVEEIETDSTSNEVIIETSNPAMGDLLYGKIIKVGDSVQNDKLKEGLLVAYPTYVGTVVRHYESDKLKILKIVVENDILFTI